MRVRIDRALVVRDDVKRSRVHSGLIALGIALSSGLLMASSCSAPPFGWQGAGRIQGLPEETTFPSDAGADVGASGPPDAGFDSGFDAGQDSGVAVNDAGMDSGKPADAGHSKDASVDAPKD